jgi:hypothetical protein
MAQRGFGFSNAQGLRLVGAAKRIERVGSDAGGHLCRSVVPSENFVVCGEGGLDKS